MIKNKKKSTNHKAAHPTVSAVLTSDSLFIKQDNFNRFLRGLLPGTCAQYTRIGFIRIAVACTKDHQSYLEMSIFNMIG